MKITKIKIERTSVMLSVIYMHGCLTILEALNSVICTSNENSSGFDLDVAPNRNSTKESDLNKYLIFEEQLNNLTAAEKIEILSFKKINRQSTSAYSNATSYAESQLSKNKATSNSITEHQEFHNTNTRSIKSILAAPYNSRKRKIVKPIKNIHQRKLASTPSKIHVFRDSDEYKKFLEELHTYKLSVKNHNKDMQCIVPSFFDQDIDIIFTKKEISDLANHIIIKAKKNKNLWACLPTIKEKNIKTKLAVIKELSRNLYKMNSIFKGYKISYYYNMFRNLNNYLIKNCSSYYNTPIRYSENNKIVKFKNYKISLGDIYSKRDINLLWHIESMLLSSTNQKTQRFIRNINKNLDDLQLKRQLLLILCIPEIYEDLFYMKYEEISRVKNRILYTNLNEADIYQSSLFCIIEYLHGIIHKNAEIMDASFKKIQIIIKNLYLSPIHSEINIYRIVYKTFADFYKYSLYLYEIDTDYHINNNLESASLRYHAMRKYLKMPQNNVTLYQGKNVVIIPNYKRCMLTFDYIDKSSNKRILDRIENKKITYSYMGKESIELSYCHHYHVQVVDNSTHRVHIMHIPFFVSNDAGTIKYNYIHTLE
ncbi:uncharacterized protein NEPG_00232, partial [Nematocida parisii ERTm1]|uniref:uncharacterized protein n=1 Tax=Nematocida parisii (strain ERTm1 / ATCC PRA-289) TaxID=881290 RepID=UPI000264B928